MKAEGLETLKGRALILGASSGFGAATAVALAQAGCDIIGVHMDRRATIAQAETVIAAVRGAGREAWFYNTNAADDARRDEVLDAVERRMKEHGGVQPLRVVLHSLAFGSLLPLANAEPATSSKQLMMTSNVMAHSFVSWTQCLTSRGMIGDGSRVLAMTSAGAHLVWPGYGAVSGAKAALESYVRQLAIELAPLGATVNAICAGVTDTAALRKIPTYPEMIQAALRKNPHNRLTTVHDVASAILALVQPRTYWMTGNVIRVDGGENLSG